MNILGDFLSSDVRSRITSFKEWLYEPYEFTSSNVTGLEKENGYILLSCLFDENDPPHELKLTNEQFIYILDTWEKLYKESPDKIIITKENDIITMLGINKQDA